MKTKLSGLMDGELAAHETQETFAALRQDAELRNRWLEYQVIGDALKGERDLHVELTARVMAAVDAEPTVLAPRPSNRQSAWQRHTMAIAATLAGVGVVGWLALGSGLSPKTETLASRTDSASVNVKATVQAPAVQQAGQTYAAPPVRQASREMQEYLIAHEAQSSLLQFRGGAEHIRTVAAVGTAPAK